MDLHKLMLAWPLHHHPVEVRNCVPFFLKEKTWDRRSTSMAA